MEIMSMVHIYVQNVVLDSILMVGVAIVAMLVHIHLKLTILVHLALLGNQVGVMVQPQQIVVLIAKPALIPN